MLTRLCAQRSSTVRGANKAGPLRARPHPFATCHSARVAPQQSPVLRAGVRILSVVRRHASQSAHPIQPIWRPKSEKPRGLGGWPPIGSADALTTMCGIASANAGPKKKMVQTLDGEESVYPLRRVR